MSEHTSSSLYNEDESPEGRPADAKKASIIEDFIDIFYAPSQVFARREQSGFGLPLLIMTVLIGVMFIVNFNALASVMDAEFTRGMTAAMKKNPNFKPEMAEGMRAWFNTSQKIGSFIIVPIMIFLVGLMQWLMGKVVGARQTLAAALMVTSYSVIVRFVEAVVTSIQALLMDTSTLTGRFQLSLGVGRFFDPDTTNPMLLVALGRIDVFTIWLTVLLAIGLATTGKISRTKAGIAAFLVYVLAGAFQVASVARQV